MQPTHAAEVSFGKILKPELLPMWQWCLSESVTTTDKQVGLWKVATTNSVSINNCYIAYNVCKLNLNLMLTCSVC